MEDVRRADGTEVRSGAELESFTGCSSFTFCTVSSSLLSPQFHSGMTAREVEEDGRADGWRAEEQDLPK